MDVVRYNRGAWDSQVEQGNPWTVPVSPEEVEAARKGRFRIVLTPTRPVPSHWFPSLDGCRVLCLAGAGGQQAPLLAAAGGKVTVLDNSEKQLDRDRMVARRDGLDIATVQGDMRDLSVFGDGSFDFIVHPVSNCFVPELQPVWDEAFRVVAGGGTMIAGVCNPATYVFDERSYREGKLVVRHSLPYSDLESIDDAERERYLEENEPLCFSHSLETQIGGQLKAGFVLVDFYEDCWGSEEQKLMDSTMPSFFATRARKP